MTPPAGGFWEHGNFEGAAPKTENPWRFASKMAPFDQEVLFQYFKNSKFISTLN